MSVIAYRSMLVRKIEHLVSLNNVLVDDPKEQARKDGAVDAYSTILWLVGDGEDL